MSERCLLAFSGGLDTSFCVVHLRERGYRVLTVTVNTGGFDAETLAELERRSAALGAEAHYTIDAREELFDDYLRYLIYGNCLRGASYPLSVAAERVCQAARVARLGQELEVDALAHGATGAGNDQVRFDVAFRVLAPGLTLLAPVRELGIGRSDEAETLRRHGYPANPAAADYSVNDGLWGSTVGGRETLSSWPALPPECYPGGAPDPAKPAGEHVLGFEAGIPASLDGEVLPPVPLIERVNELAGAYGVGRGIHLGDTVLGIKGRVGYSAPAAALIIGAHRELEKLVLSGKQQFWKETLGNLYASLVHEAQYFDPLARDVEAFLAASQHRVSGEARVRLYPGGFAVEGVRSPHSLMDSDIARYGEGHSAWTGAEAAGFSKLYGMAQQLAAGEGTCE